MKSVAVLLALLLPTLAANAQPKRFDVTDFGALGDGAAVNTKAIQAAIDRAASEGGGILVIPKGTFVTGALFFKPGVGLLVEKDGILKGTTSRSDYPVVQTRFEGIERPWISALLNFDNSSNIEVSGEGMIDGSGDVWMQSGARGRGARGATTQPGSVSNTARGPTTSPVPGWGRPRLLCFTNCRNIRIADLHLQKQASWCLHILYSQDIVVENVNIRAVARIPSSDGIDIDSSHDVRISKCDIDCNDDNIAIKCGKDEDGLRVNRPSENITISDCAIGAGGGITMGSEVSGSIRHVVVERCTFSGTGAAARFKSQPSRGGVVEDIVFRDITLNNPRQAFEFNLEWRMVPPIAPPARVLTVMRNIRLVNFTGSTQSVGVMHGLNGSPVRDVKFENCNISARTGLRMSNAVDIDTSGLKVQVEQGEPVIRSGTATQPGM